MKKAKSTGKSKPSKVAPVNQVQKTAQATGKKK